jgi:hypothetical protein
MFWFKPKKIIVDCFTHQPMVAEKYDIRRSSKSVPSWWKGLKHAVDIPTSYGVSRPSPTMKSCTGFLGVFQQTWTVPLWTDFILSVKEDGSYNYLFPHPMEPEAIGSHPPYQYGFSMADRVHVKITPPWIVWEKTGVNFGFFGAEWSLLNDLPSVRVVPGIVNYKDQHGLAVNFFVDKKEANINFVAGTPLVYLVPLTEKRVEFKTHVVTNEEWNRLERYKALYQNKFVVMGKWP